VHGAFPDAEEVKELSGELGLRAAGDLQLVIPKEISPGLYFDGHNLPAVLGEEASF
jgi:hypothetical protein